MHVYVKMTATREMLDITFCSVLTKNPLLDFMFIFGVILYQSVFVLFHFEILRF